MKTPMQQPALAAQQEIEKLEQRIAELEKQLEDTEQAADVNNHQLAPTQEQLIQAAKLATVGQLTAGLAHELNQPLGRILLTAELVQSQLQQIPETEAICKKLERIIKDVNQASTLIKHLRLFSQQSLGCDKETLDLATVINEVMMLFAHRFKKHNIQTQLTFGHGDSSLFADPGQIEQVLCNVLTNAIDAMSEVEKPLLKIITDAQEKFVAITIEDNGCGMSKQLQQNMFDPFFTTKSTGKGMGLGLSISKGIVDSHQGELSVTCDVGQGCSVKIKLPSQG